MKKQLFSALCLSFLLQAGAFAKVVLPDILSDNMVLQQNTEVKLWGDCTPGCGCEGDTLLVGTDLYRKGG